MKSRCIGVNCTRVATELVARIVIVTISTKERSLDESEYESSNQDKDCVSDG